MVWAARFSPGFAGAGVTFSGAPDFPAALAILTATQRLLVAATIRAPLGSEAALFLAGALRRPASPPRPWPSRQPPSVSSARQLS